MGIGEIRTRAATDDYRSNWERIFRGQRAPLFVVNGDEVRLDEKFLTMEEAARAALAKTHNAGRPFGDWELRSEEGHLHDATRALTADDARACFFLTLRAGANG